MFTPRWLNSLKHRPFLQSKTSARRRRAIRHGICRNDFVSHAVEILESRALLSATPVASESLVNGSTPGNQVLEIGGGQAIAAAANGSYVVAWDSDAGDGSGWGIRARRFNANGSPAAAEFTVNTTTTDNQQRANVAMANDGRFIVVWQSRLQDGSGWGIYAQRYDSAGAKAGGQILINQTTSGDQTSPAVTFLINGGFAVAWRGKGTGDTDGVFARVFDANGNAASNELRVNVTTANGQTEPSIASDGAGGFAVAWSGNGTGDSTGIFFRRFNGSGTALTGEVRVNQTTSGTQNMPSVALLGNGNFVVAWTSNSSTNGNDVRARRLDGSGAALAGEFTVNQTLSGSQQRPSVAATAQGFAIAWEGNVTGDSSGVAVRQYNLAGTALTGEERVNQTTSSTQQSPGIAATSAGFIVAWNGNGPGDSTGVFVRRYEEGPIVVNTLVDSVDINPGDGIVADSAGRRSLRAAIMEANALPGTQVIVLGAGTYTFTRAGANEDAAATGDLDITDNLIIQGAGPSTIISAAGLDRVFQVFPNVTLTLDGVRIRDGKADVGAGIANQGNLTLRNSTISNNAAVEYGGGLFNILGTADIQSSAFSANSAHEGGGIANIDGGQVTVRNSTVSGNAAEHEGGGLTNEIGTLIVIDSQVVNNTSADDGGGIFNFAGIVNVSGTAFTANAAGSSSGDTGGGIENTGNATHGIGVVNVTNSTFTNNSAFEGGGLMNRRGGTATVNGSTFTSNTAKLDGGGIGNTEDSTLNVAGSTFKTNKALGGAGEDFGGGGIATRKGTVNVSNALFSQNSAVATPADLAAGFDGYGGGLVAVEGAIVHIAHSQFVGNSADTGGGIYNGEGDTVDKKASTLEIASSTFTNNSAHGGGGAVGTEVSFLKIADSTFTDNTSGRDGGAIDNFGSTVAISGSTFTSNDANGSGGAIENSGRVTARIGQISIVDSTVTGNTAQQYGGGIRNYRDSVLDVSRSTIDHNTAALSGGGIANIGAPDYYGGVANIANSTVSGNTASQAGGGVYNDRNFTSLTNDTVAFNSAPIGGGIFNEADSTPAAPTIAIDGNFADWASVPNYADAVNDQHDTDHDGPTDAPAYVNHPDVDLLSYKVAHDNDNLYFYFESRGVIGRTQTATAANGFQAGRYYVIVTADVDNNDAAGYPLHEGGYYPTTSGYDMNAELEFFNGAINTGHYLQHGAANAGELRQAFADQSNGGYVWGGPDTQGPFAPGFVNVVPGSYDYYTQWVYKENDPALGGNDSVTFVKDKGPVVLGNIQYALSADGHRLEMIVPYKGFLIDANGSPIVTLGKTLDLSFSLEASGELSNEVSAANPQGKWASDTGNPINAYFLGATSAGVQLENTIVAGNTGSTNRDVSGVFDSQGHNLVGNVGSATGFGATGDKVGVNAATVLSSSLANNGGPTKTHALLSGSSAIDAGDNGPLSSTVDQRGLPRIVDGDGNGSALIDIGAVEFQTPASLARLSPSQLDALFANPKALDAVLS